MTRLGDYSKFLVAHSLTKVAKMYGDFLVYFENNTFKEKNCCGYFWATLGKIWATFYLSIWSHWLLGREYSHNLYGEHSSKIIANVYKYRADTTSLLCKRKYHRTTDLLLE